jgi:hypothetical protein
LLLAFALSCVAKGGFLLFSLLHGSVKCTSLLLNNLLSLL